MRLPPRRKMRPDSPAFRAEKFRVPNQRRKEPRIPDGSDEHALTQKKAGFPCSALNAGSSFISQDEGMSESPVEIIEKDIFLNLFWTEGLISF